MNTCGLRAAAGVLALFSLTGTSRSDDLHRGLVSYYPLDTVSADGTTTPDVVSGNDMVLMNMNAEALVAGRFGQALDFNGVDQYAVYHRVVENGLPISRSYAYTVAFWVRAEGAPLEEIFAQPPEPVITLITCGGEYVPSRREYLDRLIVKARGA